MSPDAPPTARPVDTDTEPDAPPAVAPVDNTTPPLEPRAPPFAEPATTSPLDVDALTPL
jgi:hypothetical protein